MDIFRFADRYWLRFRNGALTTNIESVDEILPFIQNADPGVTVFQRGDRWSAVVKEPMFMLYLETQRSRESLMAFIEGFRTGLRVHADSTERETPLAEDVTEGEVEGLNQTYQIVPIDEQDTLIVADARMRSIVHYVDRVVAPNHPAPVLIVGETGTGKEVIAKLIAKRSRRRLVPVLVSGLPPEVVPVHLFGARSGAFTGAADREGVFAAAGDGIVFLDEIGDLPVEYQSVLLRAIDRGEVQRLGEDTPVRVRCRFLAATTAERLERIRPDLRFRLMHFYIECPPLRERPADIVAITHYVLTQQRRRSVDASLYTFLLERQYPGNVRQLIHFLHALADSVPGNETFTVRHTRMPMLQKLVESLG